MAQATGSPANIATSLLLVSVLSLGLVYLVPYMTSSLSKFPGPLLACKFKASYSAELMRADFFLNSLVKSLADVLCLPWLHAYGHSENARKVWASGQIGSELYRS